MFEPMVVQSHRGPYTVFFDEDALASLGANPPPNAHFLVDERVHELHGDALGGVVRSSKRVLTVRATEEAKSLSRLESYVQWLLDGGVRRSDVVVAVGGGIVQDIACFVSSILLRGIPWRFYPTTLLAQADSCIGSKSSINVGSAKNLVGTFYPPDQVHVSTRVLATLDERDVRSGVGEMLKVHAIDGAESFDRIADDYELLFKDPATMERYIRASLDIKRRLVEVDEFDRGPRNVMNYGHSFGHAIEAATEFAVPHGIAVSIGMDLANFVASRSGMLAESRFLRMRSTLAANYTGFEQTPVPLDAFFAALGKDKKNVGKPLTLILPSDREGVGLHVRDNDPAFRETCREFLEVVRPS